MVRTPLSTCGSIIKKGKWSAEEDRQLKAYVTRYGGWNWRQLPRFAGLSRCGKSCRLRWMNYLSPNIRKGNYSKEEEETILKLHKSLGNKWSVIAAHLPGRTDNGIKNYWNTKLKKREPQQTLISDETSSFSHTIDDSLHGSAGTDGQHQLDEFNFLEKQTVFRNFDESQASSPQSARELQSNLIVEEGNSLEFNDNFWENPFVSETDSYFSTDLFDGFKNRSPPLDQLLWGDSLFDFVNLQIF